MNLMLRGLRKILTKIGLPYLPHISWSFSQDGEDIVLKSFYERYSKDYQGFYVDIGAHHPFRFSNTYLFYRQGWRGINVDATPGSMRLFNKYRKRDINIEAGIGLQNEELTFFCFNDPALNTFDKKQAKSWENHIHNYKIIKEIPVKVLTLKGLLDTYLQPKVPIDFFSIDVEGFDLNVLHSNDWEKYKPKFILTESYGEDNLLNDISNLLTQKGYRLVARVHRTVIFSIESF